MRRISKLYHIWQLWMQYLYCNSHIILVLSFGTQNPDVLFFAFYFQSHCYLQGLQNGFKSYCLTLVQQEVIVERNKGMAVTQVKQLGRKTWELRGRIFSKKKELAPTHYAWFTILPPKAPSTLAFQLVPVCRQWDRIFKA